MPTVTRKGQVTIPKKVRDALGLVPGTHVEFVVEPNRIVLRKDPQQQPNGSAPGQGIPDEVFDRWRGYLRDKLPAASTDEFMEMIRGARLPPEGETE
jgi:antitoxin PrlF